VYYAGAQDNGTDQFTGSFWRKVYGADGMDCAVNPSNANVAFVSSQYGNFRRTTDGGNNFSGTGPAGQSGAWVTPIAIDPVLHSTVYIGYQSLFRSTNNGATWTNISSNLFGSADIERLCIAPSNTSVIYAATLNAIRRSDDGGFTFSNIGAGLPLGAVALTDIAAGASNADHVWISLSGYSPTNKIYRSIDGGATWTNATGEGLPNLPVNCLAYQPGSNDMVYAGTDIGMFYKDNSMPRWLPFNGGLPNVMISDLEILPGINKIRAATYGRGLWESDLASSVFHTTDAGAVAFSALPAASCSPVVTPDLQIQNFGSSTLNALTIHYRVDGGTVQTLSWNGSLASLAAAAVTLPQLTLADGPHVLEAFVSDPNGVTDPNPVNDSARFEITVIATPAATPVQEGFENPFPLPAFRFDDAQGILDRTNAAGGWGLSSWSLRAAFYDHPNGTADVTSLPMDMTQLSQPELTFDVAYKRTVPTIRDSLMVLVSSDCGFTWDLLYYKFGSTLYTAAGYGYAPFVPAPSEWRNEKIPLAAYGGVPDLLVRFRFVSKYGNYLYVDNINIDNAVSVDETAAVLRADVFPVPAREKLQVRLGQAVNGTLVAELVDFTGRQVLSEILGANGGDYELVLPPAVQNGSYLLRLRSGGTVLVNRPVVVAGR
jgi:hypothetical protein